ncbi:MAG: MG2 domain-containing protein, partial [Elusimicrobia bacterium]|nr:MG2 domain-containing protein [Elusimicrobiota bacterium]
MLSLILAALWALPASAGTSVEQFSPQGLARGVRQVVARFSAPMVPFGDPRGLIQPFEIDCAEKGASRWADGRNWVFDFDRDLPAGVSCRFRLKPGTRALDGSELDGRREFAFTTGGPAIARSNPYEGSRVAEDQLFILHLDGEATPESVLAHAAFWVEGLGEAVGVRLATGAAREQILRAARVDDSTTTLVLGARLNFPPDRKLSLVWGRGVAAPSGAATETDQALAFKVRPDFTASFTCERVNAREDCLPLSSLSVDFTAPIRAKDARHVTLEQIGAAATAGPRRNRLSKPEQDEEGLVHRVSFEGPFPAESEFRIHLPAGLQDDAGRPLANAMRFPLTVRTGGYPPLAKFPARFGILEAGAEPAIPLTIRSLEAATATRTLKVERNVAARLLHIGKTTDLSEILSWLDRVNRPEQSWDKDHPESDWRSSILDGQAEPKRLPRPRGEKAFEVIGIPVPQPGFYVAELESEALGSSLFGEPRKMYVPTAALVTDLSVHLKHGRQSSLVWVTSLAEGAPVQDARVAVTDCNGAVLWTGSTDAAGLARVPALLGRTTCPRRYLSEGFAAAAWKGGDFAFALERWDDGIEPWRFQLPTGSLYEDESRAHTVFDRTLLRAGEVVHMKHFLRRLDAKGFGLPDARPAELIIRHAGSEEADVKLPVAWSADGTAESAWPIPAQAKLGVYEGCFGLPGKGELESGSFHVEEFRVPLMKATVAPPAEPLVAVSTVPLDLAVRYLSGGGADGMPVRLRTRLVRSSPPSFDRFEEYQFANGPVPPSSRHGEAEPEPPMRTLELNLGAGGTARASITGLELQEYPQTLEAELEFRDPNGETQTAAARAPVWPGERLVAVKADSWASSAEGLKLRVAVADLQGHAASGAPVRVDLFQRKTFSHRKRLVGGFYAYDHSEQIAPLGTACAGVTDEHGLFLCEAKSPVSGSIFAQAVTEDEKGRSSTAHTELWVAGKGEWWFEVSDNDRMDVLAENRRYEPGETAKLQVRMPFAQATALVTVEREGILDAFVEKLSRKNPVVRVPVRGDHAPNVFVSVLAVRGREGKPQPTALVDLARPAFRLGFAELRVGYAGHELKVRVSPEREVYHTRETARVKIEVRGPGGAKAAGAEAAVAAVDEGLLQLLPNDSWNLLDGLMGRRDLAVVTATAQMQVVGRRHFGLKALPAGGGGGRKTTRELFDTLLLWKGR